MVHVVNTFFLLLMLMIMIFFMLQVTRKLDSLESKVHRLLGAQGMNPVELSAMVKELACIPGSKIEAIRLYREETGVGLAEAKRVVETYINSLPG